MESAHAGMTPSGKEKENAGRGGDTCPATALLRIVSSMSASTNITKRRLTFIAFSIITDPRGYDNPMEVLIC